MVVAPFVSTWPLINKKNKKGLLCRPSQKKKKNEQSSLSKSLCSRFRSLSRSLRSISLLALHGGLSPAEFQWEAASGAELSAKESQRGECECEQRKPIDGGNDDDDEPLSPLACSRSSRSRSARRGRPARRAFRDGSGEDSAPVSRARVALDE